MPLSPQVLFANLNISDYMKIDIFYLNSLVNFDFIVSLHEVHTNQSQKDDVRVRYSVLFTLWCVSEPAG